MQYHSKKAELYLRFQLDCHKKQLFGHFERKMRLFYMQNIHKWQLKNE